MLCPPIVLSSLLICSFETQIFAKRGKANWREWTMCFQTWLILCTLTSSVQTWT
jgi:hypothetical protein